MNAVKPDHVKPALKQKPMESFQNGSTKRLWDYLTRLASAATLVIAGAIIAHEIRLSVIENTRFTAKDGLLMQQSLRSEWQGEIKQLVLEMKELKVLVRENLAQMNERFIKIMQEASK